MGTAESPQLGFASDIKLLFREKDRNAMLRAFDLWSYADVVAHAEPIAQQLREGTMPCDGAWPTPRPARHRRESESRTSTQH